jgi:hypothetical protein
MSEMLYIFFRHWTMQKENIPINSSKSIKSQSIILGELHAFYLYILDLFNNAFNSQDNTASNDKIISE